MSRFRRVRSEPCTVGSNHGGDLLRVKGDVSGDYVDIPAGDADRLGYVLENWDALPKTSDREGN